jgi:hypothetical protein
MIAGTSNNRQSVRKGHKLDALSKPTRISVKIGTQGQGHISAKQLNSFPWIG